MQNNTMNKIIAITGGIGSGKSTALKIVEKLGYKSFNADLTYKELLLDEDFVIKISNEFSITPLIENGKKVLDRKALSKLVFEDEKKLNKLNALTHPAIMQKMIDNAKMEKGLKFCEVPLLYEGNFDTLFDFIFVIIRDDTDRINSVKIRDGKTLEQIEKIIKNQFNYTKIEENEHTFIIENDGDEDCLTEKIKVAIKKIS
ncbi:MAG: dephospho-CoA kinase [Clostridiales bacterium]|nr:dephospho-CoA kinase [Clostridiales bacterium]